MVTRTCKHFNANSCPIQFSTCDTGDCRHYERDDNRACCGCLLEEVYSNWCCVCEMMTISCSCNPYGTCQCS